MQKNAFKLKLTYFWQRRSWLNYLLLPLSALYYAVISLRRYLYANNILKTVKLSVPVIVVGNITVGGTGKTPLVIAVVKFLQAHGYTPGVISRGYGGRANQYPYPVTESSDPKLVGDEPVLIARRAGCPVVIDPRRVCAAEYLLTHFACDIIISDDGLQHYALSRDIEIAVIDGERRLGNALLLPAGPLRELPERLTQVDFIVCNGKAKDNEYMLQLAYDGLYNLINPIHTLDFAKLTTLPEPIYVAAGIGNPQRLFNDLKQAGIKFIAKPFPDHHSYIPADLAFAKMGTLLLTEKDAVKCAAFAQENYWCLAVSAKLEPAFSAKLLELIGKVQKS